jgi:uncharacterized membrane protein
MLVLGFGEPDFTGQIAAELDRLRSLDFIRIVDAMVVNKDDDGDITSVQVSDLSADETTQTGTIIGALIGFRQGGGEDGALAGEERMADGHLVSDEETWYVADTIPNGSAAAIILIEHLRAILLREAIVSAESIALADRWIHASDLIEVGFGVADA